MNLQWVWLWLRGGVGSLRLECRMGIVTTSNKKVVDHKVVDPVKYYNFSIKFIFIEHQIRKLQSFFVQNGISLLVHVLSRCRFKPTIGGDNPNITLEWAITTGSSHKPALIHYITTSRLETGSVMGRQ